MHWGWRLQKYDETQPRDDRGRWTEGSGAAGHDTPEFKNWFAGSKVVTADGKPLVVYHGSGKDIEAFDASRQNPDALYGPGFYFTESAATAGGSAPNMPGSPSNEEDLYAAAPWNLAGYAYQGREFSIDQPLTPRQMSYAKRLFGSKTVERDARSDIGVRASYVEGWKAWQAGEAEFRKWLATDPTSGVTGWFNAKLKSQPQQTTAPAVYPVHLSIKNPLDLDAKADPRIAARMFARAGDASASASWSKIDSTEHAWSAVYAQIAASTSKAKANNIVQAAGFDGMTHEGGNVMGWEKHRVWIAFDPAQVKSIHNVRPTSDPRIAKAA